MSAPSRQRTCLFKIDMNHRTSSRLAIIGCILLMQAGCSTWKFTRVPPGQSVAIALSKKATPVEQPPPILTLAQPLPEPDLPKSEANLEALTDYFALGNLC